MTPFVVTRLFLKFALLFLLAAVVVGMFVRLFRGERQDTAHRPRGAGFRRLSMAASIASVVLAGALIAGWFYVARHEKVAGTASARDNSAAAVHEDREQMTGGAGHETQRPVNRAVCDTTRTQADSSVTAEHSSRWPGRWVLLGAAIAVIILLIVLSKAMFRRVDHYER